MEIEGKVVEHLELVTGQSARGEWKKQEFILETEGQYPKKVCISLWGDKVADLPNINAEASVSINLESREYNGRWYTEVRAWKIEAKGAANSVPAPNQAPPKVENIPSGDGGDDLPF